MSRKKVEDRATRSARAARRPREAGRRGVAVDPAGVFARAPPRRPRRARTAGAPRAVARRPTPREVLAPPARAARRRGPRARRHDCGPRRYAAARPIGFAADDLRRKVREHRSPFAVCFVVDNSWSVHAERMVEKVKGVVFELLEDATRRGDQVALVAFRGGVPEATVALPPTSSLALARRRLEAIPLSGQTPLADALRRARLLLRGELVRHPNAVPLVVVVTDGLPTVPLRRRRPGRGPPRRGPRSPPGPDRLRRRGGRRHRAAAPSDSPQRPAGRGSALVARRRAPARCVEDAS